MDAPGIKGSALIGLVQDLKAHLEEGRVSEEELEARLRSDDLALIAEGKLLPTQWVPLDQYERLSEALFSVAGSGADRAAFFHGRGRGAADRLIRSGVYQQLDFVARKDASQGIDGLVRDTKLRLSLMAGMLNRGRAHVEVEDPQSGEMSIEVREAADIPDCLAHTLAGFMERCAEEGGVTSRRWRAQRPVRDVIRLSYRA